MKKPEPPALDPEQHALYLDFDGTLVDLAPVPDAIALRPGTIPLLGAAAERLGGALAIVSGRRIDDLDTYLHPLVLPAAGQHGQEYRLPSGERVQVPPPAELETARGRIREDLAAENRLFLEDKGASLVVHFRLHPEARLAAEAIVRDAVIGLPALRIMAGNGVFEILRRQASKGEALRRLSSLPPFSGRIPVSVGDDPTDEEAIRAAIAAGGIGVRVGSDESAAPYNLRDVSAVHRWLGQTAAAFVTEPRTP